MLVVSGLLGAGLFCVASAQGQAVGEEGFPAKPVSSEDASGGEACVAVLFPGEFEERCIEGNEAEGLAPFGGQAGALPLEASDPLWSTPPRLECPSAVFLEELETGSIDCRAWDVAGEDGLDYFWEPSGGTTRDYLENPRLTPEDVPNPAVVAPSSPHYDTLESFFSEEGDLRYRYRLRATSRATGLSSFAEVDVFVAPSRPGVYCPLQMEVEEGSTVALACEGADPLSFRMDSGDEDGRTPALWEWEGLWGTSTIPLAAANTSSPLFTAPSGSAGETYHYVASMTTTSSGVPRTARRRVSVTVKAGQGVAAPGIDCPDSQYEFYENTGKRELKCTATDAPAGATYEWSGTDFRNRLTKTDALVTEFKVPPDIFVRAGYVIYNYTVTMLDGNEIVDTADVSVRVLEKPNISYCLNDSNHNIGEGGEMLTLVICTTLPEGAPGDMPTYRYKWTIDSNKPNPPNPLSPLSDTRVRQPVFTSPDDVSRNTLYHYLLTISADNADPYVLSVNVLVKNLDKGAFSLACTSLRFNVFSGAPDIPLECLAPGAPDNATWKWTARNPTTDTNRLSATNVRDPVFDVPPAAATPDPDTYYYSVSVSADGQSQVEDVDVNVIGNRTIVISCSKRATFYEGDSDEQIGACTFTQATNRLPDDTFQSRWGGISTTDMRFQTTDEFVKVTLSDTTVHTPLFHVPNNVDKNETYMYKRRLIKGTQAPSANATVTVLNRDDLVPLALVCETPVTVEAGSDNINLSCKASGLSDESAYRYQWNADPLVLARLIEDQDTSEPLFAVPSQLGQDTTYEYTLTVSADNAVPATEKVTVTVTKSPALLFCNELAPVYEGSSDIQLPCDASGFPDNVKYSWEPPDRLIAGTDTPMPTFDVPDVVDMDEVYEYKITASVEGDPLDNADVAVTVLNKPRLAVQCQESLYTRYEGDTDFAIICTALDVPEGAEYAYVWEARGNTADTHRLIAGTDGPTPTFDVPDMVDMDETYEYRLTVSAENAESETAEVTVRVLNKVELALSCANPAPVYEGSADITLSCALEGAAEPSGYMYDWAARGATPDTERLSAADVFMPVFDVPDQVDRDETYEYQLTVSGDNVHSATGEITVTVLNKDALALSCPGDPYSAYEGSEDLTLDCEASGASDGAAYEYVWEARGATANTDRLVAGTDGPMPVFDVPDMVDENETYEYRLTVSAENADPAMADVTVVILNTPAVALSCPGDPYEAYEGSGDLTLDCEASGAPEGSEYEYAWEARGATPDTERLSATDVVAPNFAVPDSVGADETYEYRLTASAENADPAMIDVTVTVLDRPPPPDPTSIGITASVSALRFGVQSSGMQVALDPLSDQISTHLSGPYHAGRMMLLSGDTDAATEGPEKALSIEMITPVTLRLEGDVEGPSLSLEPSWSYAPTCEQLSTRAVGGLYLDVTLSESDCRLLVFGGELDLSDAALGRYSGNLDVALRAGAGEETHSLEVEVTVAAPQRVTTIGPKGVRFGVVGETSPGLTQEQNLSIFPDFAFLTREEPSGAFTLSNPSLVPLETSVSVRFGYAEATEDGGEAVVEDPAASRLGDLSEALYIHPRTLVLMPGEQGVVRYGVDPSALSEMTDSGYAAFFEIASAPRQYVRPDRLPEAVSDGETGRVTIRLPGAYVPRDGASQLRAELLSLSEGASLSATFLVEAGRFPFAGEVVAYDGDGRELGRRRTLVHTRSRVVVPLAWRPEDEVVFLRFAPLRSDRVSEPVSIPWGGRRQGIGASLDDESAPERPADAESAANPEDV